MPALIRFLKDILRFTIDIDKRKFIYKKKGEIFMFLKQKKETKRKISFFMAAALVFSLIPAPSIANAAEKSTPNAKLQGNVDNATIKINETTVVSGNSVSLQDGKVTIIVEADNGYMFDSVDNITLETEVTGETGETTAPSSTPSGGAVSPDETDTPSTTPSSEPTETPSSAPTDAPTTEPTATASPTPVVTETPGTPTSEPATGGATSGSSTEAAAYSLRENTTGTISETKTSITFELTGITKNILIKLSGSAKPDTRQFKVTFENKLAKASYKAECDSKAFTSGNSVTGGSIVSLVVNADANCVFKDTPVVMANDIKAELTPNETNTSYSVKGGIKITSETKVSISGKAYEKFNVTIKDASATLKNATLTATYNNKEFTGGQVLEGDAVILKITPKEGYAFTEVPVVKAGTATVPSSAFEKVAGGAYNVTVTIEAATELSVEGTAALQKLTDASPDDNANNASLAETDFTDEKVLGSFLNAFANDQDIDEAKANEIKTAVSKNEAYIQAALNVTGASAEAKTEATGLIKKDTSLGINTDNLSEENSAFLDITLASICKKVSDNSTMASIIIEELDNKIAVTMDLPKFTAASSGKDRKYIVIRIHGSKAERLPDADVTVTDKKIKFLSDKFSTYVITFEDTDKATPEPSPTSGSTTKPVVPPAYNPGGGSSTATATPVPSAAPSTEPYKSPDAAQSPAPGTTDTASPSEKPAEPEATNKPDVTPETTKQPATGNGGSSSKIKVGKNVTISNTKYKVTSVSGTKAVQFTGTKKNVKKVVIPSAVKVGGKKFKVTSIANNALKGNKKITKLTIGANINKIGKNAFNGCSSLKSITIKSKKLTAKKTGKNAFKGINKKAVIKVPKAKTKAYKKIVKAKGAPKTVKIKK